MTDRPDDRAVDEALDEFANTATEEIVRLREENAQLEAHAAALRFGEMALHDACRLAEMDDLYVTIEVDTDTFYVNCNDEFAPGVDGETFPLADAIEVRAIYQRDGRAGVMAHIAARRNRPLARPHRRGAMGEHAMTPVDRRSPLWRAWLAYTETDEFRNTKRWLTSPTGGEGELWAAFAEGFTAALAPASPAPEPEASVTAEWPRRSEVIAMIASTADIGTTADDINSRFAAAVPSTGNHGVRVLTEALADIGVARDSVHGSLFEQVAYELRQRAAPAAGTRASDDVLRDIALRVNDTALNANEDKVSVKQVRAILAEYVRAAGTRAEGMEEAARIAEDEADRLDDQGKLNSAQRITALAAAIRAAAKEGGNG